MAQEITTNQVGNQIIPQNDPDYIAPEEKGADQQELEAQALRRAQEERERLEAEQAERHEETQRQRREPPTQNLEGEARRLREQRDRLRSEKEQADREVQQLREERAKWVARQEVEREAQERIQRLQQQANRPDPEVDPYGAQLWDLQQEVQAQKQIRQQWEEQNRQAQAYYQQQQQTQGVLQEIQTYVVDDVTRFKQENPEFDYDSAAKHVKDRYMEFWQGTGLTSQEAEAVTANTFLAVGRSAQLRQQSAAQAIANLAKLTGYDGRAAGSREQGAGNGARPSENPQEKISRIAKGQKLQGLGGKTPSERTAGENVGLLTAQQMAEMSDDDYLRLKQDPQMARLLEKRLEELG